MSYQEKKCKHFTGSNDDESLNVSNQKKMETIAEENSLSMMSRSDYQFVHNQENRSKNEFGAIN
jgi:hypothetical protein